jgi:hypothetical protein
MSRTRWALATLLAACLFGACSDNDPKPDIADPTSSAATSAATSVGPTSSHTASLNPEQTVRAWIVAWNRALQSGDASELREFDANPCRGCDELIGPVEQISSAGGAFEGGDWKIDGLKVVSETNSQAKVNLGVDVAAGSTTPSAGASPTAYPAVKHLLSFTLVSDPHEWRVSVIEVLS